MTVCGKEEPVQGMSQTQCGQVRGCGQPSGCGQPDGARRPLDPQEMAAWRAFLLASTSVTAALNRELEEGAGISLHEYEILVRLLEAEGNSLRMSVLAQGTAQSRSRLTHTVSRLEKAGHVSRSSCPSDRRGVFCHLTETGRQFLARTAALHLDGVRRHVIDRVPPDQLALLTSLLTPLAED